MESDNELKFDIHCEKLFKSASKVASIKYHMRVFFSSNQLHQVYRSYVQPFYQYGVLIYGTANKSLLIKNEKATKIDISELLKAKKNMKTWLRLKRNLKSATLENYISMICLSN